MWDWIRKAAGAVLETGAGYLRHLNAIQQIMNAPSYEAAVERLRGHVFGMDGEAEYRLFMTVVGQQIQQAEQALQQARENPGGDSWGNSFEDRMAQHMAEIQAGYHAGNSPHVQAAEKRLHDLNLLARYAQQFWQERAPELQAPDPPPPSTGPEVAEPDEPAPAERMAAFQRHARAILGDPVPAAPGADAAPAPLGEIEALQAMLAADRRLTRGMMATMPGSASAGIVEELSDLHRSYARILRDAPGDSSLIEPADLRRKMGQCQELAGRAWESLRDDAAALARYERALAEFRQAGDGAEAERMERKIRDLQILLSGDHDAEILAIQERLDTVARPSLEAAELLIALGVACTHAGDAFAGREHLHQAETMLRAMGIEPPSAEQLASDLFGSMQALLGGAAGTTPAPIEASMKVRAVYKQLYQALSAAYRDSDPADADFEENLALADRYLKAWEAMDSRQQSDAFSAKAMDYLRSQGHGPAKD